MPNPMKPPLHPNTLEPIKPTDLAGYEKYFSGKLTNYELPDDEIKKSLAG